MATRESPCVQQRRPSADKAKRKKPKHASLLSGSVKVARSSDSLRPHGLYSPWNSPGQNAGVGSRSLLQGVFPTQEMRAFNVLGCMVSF